MAWFCYALSCCKINENHFRFFYITVWRADKQRGFTKMCNKKGTLSANADRGNRNKLGTFAFLFTFIFLACLKIPFTRPAPLVHAT